MRSRWTLKVASPLLAMSLVTCTDSVGPGTQDLVELFLDFCANETPTFFAVQNEGGAWTRLTPDASGTFTFRATDKVGLAIIHQVGADASSEYIFTTPDELRPLSGVACAEQAGVKTLSGTVSTAAVGSATMISMAGQFAYVNAPTTGYSLTALPSGPLDLIAQREILGTNDVVPDRVIIRRAQDRTHGSSIPVLDFGASESQSIAPHSFSATGLSANDDTYYLLNFNTSTTRGHSLVPLTSFTSGAKSLYGIPAGLTQVGDLHELEVFADAGSSYRGATQFYRLSGSRTVALGPNLNTPSITSAATTPSLRLRAQLPSQAEYDSFVSVFYQQGASRAVVVTQTSGFTNGTPTIWDVTIPNLSGVSGFPASSALQNGTQTTWYVDAYGGSSASTFFGSPTDGAALRYAGRSSVATTMVATEDGGLRMEERVPRRRSILHSPSAILRRRSF